MSQIEKEDFEELYRLMQALIDSGEPGLSVALWAPMDIEHGLMAYDRESPLTWKYGNDTVGIDDFRFDRIGSPNHYRDHGYPEHNVIYFRPRNEEEDNE